MELSIISKIYIYTYICILKFYDEITNLYITFGMKNLIVK